MNVVQVDRIEAKKDLGTFLDFPWRVCQGDDHWVPPLIGDLKERLDPARNPFFEHVERELFLARRDDQVVGRIAAILDPSHNTLHGEKVVFFGFYESFNDSETAVALLESAAQWGKARGMEILRSAVRAGYRWGETSRQLEDNDPVNKFNLSIGGKIYRKYRVYEKKIA
jgi:hypothetical protein